MNITVTFYLHDAVYLYLRVLNQTLADDASRYNDGRFIRSKVIGQRFVGTPHFFTTDHYLLTHACSFMSNANTQLPLPLKFRPGGIEMHIIIISLLIIKF